jgi:hypothetical protein
VLAWCGGAAQAWAGPTDVTWLKPEHFATTPGAPLDVHVVMAGTFDGTGAAVEARRIASMEVRMGSEAVPIVQLPAGNGAWRNLVAFSHAGVAMLHAELQPEARSIPRSDVEGYLRALHATDEIREQWAHLEAPNPWIEVRRLALKAFVRVGEPAAGEADWQYTYTSGIDIVPEQDPTSRRQGDALAVRVLRDGRPLAGAIVDYISVGEARQHVVITDGHGRAAAALNARGAWLVRCFDVHRSSAENHEWEVSAAVMAVATR